MRNIFKPTLEIKSKAGELHFRRWTLVRCRFGSLFLHRIYRRDKDDAEHDHPWDFTSLVLYGGYWEQTDGKEFWRGPGSIVKHVAEDTHKLTVVKDDTWTLVFAGPTRRVWGYQTKEGWLDSKTFRKKKNENR